MTVGRGRQRMAAFEVVTTLSLVFNRRRSPQRLRLIRCSLRQLILFTAPSPFFKRCNQDYGDTARALMDS